jgi:uncharacterized protein (DUF433 family)
MLQTNLLETGIYMIPEAAGLVSAPTRRLRTWVEGHKGKQAPVIDNELGKVDGKTAVSFANLMELRFIAVFSGAGVKVNKIRAIMAEAQELLRHPHPFATRTVFKTDGRKIVAEIGRRNGIEDIYDLKTKNYEMNVIVMKSLKDDVIYDPQGDAITWRPRRDIAPHVVVQPTVSFGRPVLRDSRVPTSALADAVDAEKSARTVAHIFDVPENQVREAVRFEASLRRLH